MIYKPEKFMVGFQRRVNNRGYAIDTDMDNEYVLAFATYKDEKGNIKQQKSWENWKHAENPVLTFDNDPIQGFNIIGWESHSSGGWGSVGRSVYCVEDPRGFVLQINSGNLVEIIRQCNIEKGIIQSKCVWAWDRLSLMLVPEGTDLYKEGIEAFRLKNQKISLKDINIGDKVKLQTGEEGIWFGRQYILNHRSYYGSRSNKSLVIEHQKPKYIIILENKKSSDDATKNYIEIKNSFIVSEIIKKADNPLSNDQVSEILNKHVKYNAGTTVRNREVSWSNRDKSTLDEWVYNYNFDSCLHFSSKRINQEEWIDTVYSLFDKNEWEVSIWNDKVQEELEDQMRRNRRW